MSSIQNTADRAIARDLVDAFNTAVAGKHPLWAEFGTDDFIWFFVFDALGARILDGFSCHQGSSNELATIFAHSAGSLVAVHSHEEPYTATNELGITLLPALCSAALGVTA